MKKFLTGALGGFIATIPMTAVMFLMRRGSRDEREALPPHEVTTRLAEEADLNEAVNTPGHQAVTGVAHFAFGTTVGAVYSATVEPLRLPPALKGSLYGLTVFAMSYQSVLPGAGILPPVSERSLHRNLLLIVSHLVWGITLGTTVACLQKDDR